MQYLKNIFLLLASAILLFTFSNFGLKAPPKTPAPQPKKLDCPTIDYSNYNMVHPTCNKSDGSITGMKVISTGTKILYTWHDANNKNADVGHTLDLTNVPAGVYYLEVTDNSGCGLSAFTPKLLLENANIVGYDESHISIKSSTCHDDGSITGIKVTNATSYTWYSLTLGTNVSTSTTTPDITDVAPGGYKLTAANSTCEVVKTYYVQAATELPTILSVKITDAPCGGAGSVAVSLKVTSTQPRLSFSLVKPDGTHVVDGIITNLNSNPTIGGGGDPGDYFLYVQDDNGCLILLGKYTIGGGVLDFSNPIITDDRCNQRLAAIDPNVGGYKSKRGDEFTWTDLSTGEEVSHAKILSHVGAGTYRFHLVIPGGCVGTQDYTVNNVSPSLVPPIAAGSTICLPGMINITVTNVGDSKLFKLYDSPTAGEPIATSETGVFYRQVDETTDFYVTRVNTDCESDRTKVTEVVVASIKIPNAFTPNGDGVNDTWNIGDIEKFPGVDVKIFERDGKMIFHSVNYPAPFDGTYKGKQLPEGTYYYILDVKQPICYGKISGSVTIIR